MADDSPFTIQALEYAPPDAVAARLSREPDFVWLDGAPRTVAGGSVGASPFARFSFQAAWPDRMFAVTRKGAIVDGEPVDTPPLELMRAAMAPRVAAPDAPAGLPPFLGGWIGYLAYEFGEHTMPWRSPRLQRNDATLAEFARYPAVLAWDHQVRTCTLVAYADEEDVAEALLEAHADALAGGAASAPRWSMADLAWAPRQERLAFETAIGAVKEYIAAGDIYQANLAQAFTTRLPDGASAFEHYLMLRRANPAPFSAFLDFPGRRISSTSPERFLAISPDGAVEARPIKGTIRIGADEAADREAIRYLTTSEKERAENVMIVDLLRNDLSKVCMPHTVKTPDICKVETYEGLHHLVSSVTGQLQPGLSALDAVFAAFPGGSITGAPKLRAMEVIAELEPHERGVFCGGVGYVSVDGAADFNIAIRTVEYDGADASMLAGGGVTLLSDPAAEFDETLLKAERVLGTVGA